VSIISDALPEYVSLNEFQFSFEKVFVKEKPSGKKNQAKKPIETIPELVDLENLLKRHSEENLVITLQGISPDHLSISNYMSNLDQKGIFKEIDLVQSTESIFEGQSMRVFQLRMVVNAPGTYVPKTNHPPTAGFVKSIAGGFDHE